MVEMTFRLANLRAAINDGTITDPKAIRDATFSIDRDLELWGAEMPVHYPYITLDVGGADANPALYFDGKQHLYGNTLYAQVWNDWRERRIMTNQIIFYQGSSKPLLPLPGLIPSAYSNVDGICTEDLEDTRLRDAARANILRYSTDICIASASLVNTTRKQPSVPIRDLHPSMHL
jgi:hypothetical protein